ncbi:hypothetical protein NMG60_11009056 [Bertholletia excelsa]
MDLKKKLSFSDHFPYCISPRKKVVVSGFGLGVFASLIVAGVVLFNVSLKSNVSLVSWPFSFSSFSVSSTTSTIRAEELQSSVDLMHRIGEGKVADKALESNVSLITKGGSFILDEGKEKEKASLVNGSDIAKGGNISNSHGEGASWERTYLENSSEKNIIKENVTKMEGNEVFVKNSNNQKINVNETSNNGSPGKDACPSGICDNITESYTEFRPLEMHSGCSENCDLFDGRWVRDNTKPYYPAGSCPFIDRDFDCHLNRRPDYAFVKWKWQPNCCDIPSLNATDFLERLRGQKLVFVGDSLNRNMWESLVCVLRHNVQDKKRVFEISGRRDFKKKGFYAFRFEDYNCTVDFVSSPFLVRESTFNGRNGSFDTLRLDLMDRTTSMYSDADVIVFNTGHWWTHEKTSRGEDYYQEGNHVYPRLKVLEAYKRAITTWARWVDKNVDGRRTQVVFRGYSVTHFRGGQWNSGGQCHKETEPIFNETYLTHYPSKMRALENVLQEMKTPVLYLNISRLTDYRKDGHPSIYRKEYKSVEEQISAEQSQDCSHWCLPGVPDTWNELLYASLLQAGKGSWRT